jgi:hypothetical protein
MKLLRGLLILGIVVPPVLVLVMVFYWSMDVAWVSLYSMLAAAGLGLLVLLAAWLNKVDKRKQLPGDVIKMATYLALSPLWLYFANAFMVLMHAKF